MCIRLVFPIFIPIIPVKSCKLPEENFAVIIHVLHFQITIARIVWISEYDIEWPRRGGRRTRRSWKMGKNHNRARWIWLTVDRHEITGGGWRRRIPVAHQYSLWMLVLLMSSRLTYQPLIFEEESRRQTDFWSWQAFEIQTFQKNVPLSYTRTHTKKTRITRSIEMAGLDGDLSCMGNDRWQRTSHRFLREFKGVCLKQRLRSLPKIWKFTDNEEWSVDDRIEWSLDWNLESWNVFKYLELWIKKIGSVGWNLNSKFQFQFQFVRLKFDDNSSTLVSLFN